MKVILTPLQHFLCHSFFYALACVAGFLTALWQKRRLCFPDNPHCGPAYQRALLLGVVLGGYALGSANLSFGTAPFVLAHSVLGAVAGGVLAVELYKFFVKCSVATGGSFTLPLVVGIAMGRVGCFLGGLEDRTFGVATKGAWGVDYGDGVLRHPVQLYEAGCLFLFFAVLLFWAARFQKTYLLYGFQAFLLFYGVQRFVWEFFKPYAPLWGGLGLFHFVCAGIVLYAGIVIALRMKHEHS